MSGSGSPPAGRGGNGDSGSDARHERLQALPEVGDDRVVWDREAGTFVSASRGAWPSEAGPYGGPGPGADPPSPAPPATAAVDATQAQPAPDAGAAPPASLSSSNRRHVTINAGEQAVRGGSARVGAGAPAPAPPGWSPGPSVPAAPGAPPGAPPYRPEPAPGRPPRAPRRRLRGRRLVGPLLCLPVVLCLLAFAFAYYQFNQIPRVPVSWVLSPASGEGTNWLIVGTDSREGITEDDPNAGVFLGGGEPAGNRTDSIMILRVADGKQSLLSVPRDLWVKDPAKGNSGRINGTFNSGPTNLIAAVQSLGIPVHRYLEINFVGFGKLVDSVGGIDIEFPLPARDTHSGLDVPEAGVQRLDGAQALAYVRSRFYEELKDGKWVRDPLSDLSRVQRQRTFLTVLMSKVSDTKNPFAIAGITSAMTSGLRLDDQLNLFGAIGLAMQLRGFSPESVTLPTVNATRGGAQVLDLDTAKAAPVIQSFSA